MGGVPIGFVSGQTTVANAFSIGIGPTKRVILWNTLLDGRFTPREVGFVAHDHHELTEVSVRPGPQGFDAVARRQYTPLSGEASETELRSRFAPARAPLRA